MKPTRLSLLAVAVVPLMAFGCASANVNPPAPRANTGYVDFYSEPETGLCWEVQASGASADKFKTVFSEFDPVAGDVLRLAFTPGRHRCRVTFLNRVIAKPAEVEVDVENGKITPLHIVFTEAGTTVVLSKETTRGSTYYGRPGRRTRIDSDETMRYGLSAVADAPVPYQPKARMPYAR